MRTLTTQGVIIKKRSLGEKDYVLTIFTPLYGKLEVHARGAKQISSRFTGHLDLLNVCNFQLYKSVRNYTVTECHLHTAFGKFRENLVKFYFASKIAKLLKPYETENENCEDIYGLLIETFNALEKFNKENIVFEAFKLKLFSLLGIMPDVYCIQETEFCTDDMRLKKMLKFILNNPYQEIIKLSLKPQDEDSLENLTRSLMEYSPI